jgi:hypothetical protein
MQWSLALDVVCTSAGVASLSATLLPRGARGPCLLPGALTRLSPA